MRKKLSMLALAMIALTALVGIGSWIYAASAHVTIDGEIAAPQSEAAKAKIQTDIKLAALSGEDLPPYAGFGVLRGGAMKRTAIVGASSDKIVAKTVGDRTYSFYLGEGETDTPIQAKTFTLIARGVIGGLCLGSGLLFLLASFMKEEESEHKLAGSPASA